MLKFFNQLVHRLLTLLERRRSAVLVLVVAVVFVGGSAGAFVLRPPILVPVLDAVHRGFLGIFSLPARWVSAMGGAEGGDSRLLELEIETARLRELAEENQRLRALLEYEPPSGCSFVPGRVIGLDLDPVRGVAWINRGSQHGLDGGEPVLTTGGLAGVVEAVAPRTARVRLLRNRATPVAVRATRSRVLGVVSWDPARAFLQLDYVPKQVDVAVGDTLISSGLGGVFPEGLQVGRVASVEEPPERLLKVIRVAPFASFFRLEEIFVLRPGTNAPESLAVERSP